MVACLPRLPGTEAYAVIYCLEMVLLALFFVFLAGLALAYQDAYQRRTSHIVATSQTADLNQTKWAARILRWRWSDDLVILVFYPKYSEELRPINHDGATTYSASNEGAVGWWHSPLGGKTMIDAMMTLSLEAS